MGSPELILLILAIAFGLYMAWNIGANDVANAMGTSVGSGALTLKQAIILAAIFEFTGAFLVGSHVSDTVRKKIFEPTAIQAQSIQEVAGLEQMPTSEELAVIREQAKSDSVLQQQLDQADSKAALNLACGMIAALLAAGCWLQLASYFGWPVSTTHSIVGSVVGFGAVALGVGQIEWLVVAKIVSSWLVSPLLAGAISYLLFRFLLRRVFYQPDPVAAAKQIMPYLAFVVMIVLVGVTSFKALKGFWKRFNLDPTDMYPLLFTMLFALVVGVCGAFIARLLVRRIQSQPLDQTMVYQGVYVSRSLDKMLKHLRRIESFSTGPIQGQVSELRVQLKDLAHQAEQQSDPVLTQPVYQKVERIFVYLQVLSACFVAFAHGANDVANAIGPLSAAVQSLKEGVVAAKAQVPAWALALGGVGIVVGLATWGWRVMETIGRRITELTPSRGFAAEFGAAITILVASLSGLPISTTHTLVGAVLGVGLARGIGAINLNVVRDIVASWIITIPAGAGLAVLFYFILKALFI